MRDHESGRPVGRVVGLWRYPVKSMAAEPLSEVDVSWHGFAGDRRWAFIRDGVPQSGFPWLTLRERADLNHYHPSFLDPLQPDKSATVVRTPAGVTFDVADPVLAAELHPQGARAIKHNRGIFDTFPLSLITTRTIARLGEMIGAELDVKRFRPNILVETTGAAPFQEDDWVGCILRTLRGDHDRPGDHRAKPRNPARGRSRSRRLSRRLRFGGYTRTRGGGR
jgi:uncharacterized protein YcbX